MTANAQIRSHISPIIATNGFFLVVIGMSEWAVALIDMGFGWQNSEAFWISGLIVNMLGASTWLTNREQLEDLSMNRRQVILGMITAWLTASFAAALPFMFGRPFFDFTDAYFEATSAITTTGATVMSGIETMPRSILLWRSLMHWYGGMGIVIGALMLFPAMRIGGMQFFLRVGFETSDKILPSARKLGMAIFITYLILTILCGTGYALSGMGFFDALNMSMSTMATGGFAVSDGSFSPYSNAAVYVSTLFMLFAGCPLITFLLVLRGNPKAFLRDPQIRAFLMVYLCIVFSILVYRLLHQQGEFEPVLRSVMFNSASLLTGTGFAYGDFQLWGSFPIMVMLLAMFIGGCTGSTAGSVKIFRYQVLIAMVKVRIQRLFYPHGIFHAKYDGRPLDERVMESVAAFFMIYLVNLAILTVAFGFGGLDLITAFSAAVSAVGNVGPGLGNEIGPVGNYAGFSDWNKWVFTVCMTIGRLEFMAFYALLLPRFWKY